MPRVDLGRTRILRLAAERCEGELGARKAKRKPEIATGHTAEIAPELFDERPIETVLGPQTRFELGVPRLIAEQKKKWDRQRRTEGRQK